MIYGTQQYGTVNGVMKKPKPEEVDTINVRQEVDEQLHKVWVEVMKTTDRWQEKSLTLTRRD